MAINAGRLKSIVGQLAARPGHEKIRVLLNELCVAGLEVPDNDVSFEVRIPEVSGRMDALLGSTVFEFKRDLRRERQDAESQLLRYLSEREGSTKRRYLGIATDGAEFVAYEQFNGNLKKLRDFQTSSDDPRALLQWLDTAVTARGDLPPDALNIKAEFGRESLVFARALEALKALWEKAKTIPETALKYQLWCQHLEFVYGTLIEPEILFLQHTYLTTIAKAMAQQVLTGQTASAKDLLEGTTFTQVGLKGAIETDFFNWPLLVPGGEDLIDRVAAQVGRFRLSEIKSDVLKTVYESLIDPQQRHYLGEYYTPDWLAEWMCARTITDPLNQKVLDPACGSGTFLFALVQRHLAAAKQAGKSIDDALKSCTENVVGIDVHPVAVLFARVTYLLAIGTERLQQRKKDVFVPVYLGDSLQWNVRELLTEQEVEISVPGEKPLRFPGTVAGDPHLLDKTLAALRELSDQGASDRAFKSWLNANTALPDPDRKILVETFAHMRALHQAGRDHIWTYVVRNLTRPLWLSVRKSRADVVIGNPPWLRFNAMSAAMQQRFREACVSRNLWVGGKVAPHQDLCAYFFARSAERYAQSGGTIAFVMPMAALSRAQYKKFLSGNFVGRKEAAGANVRFIEAWQFGSEVSPLFPVPSAVMLAVKSEQAGQLPKTVTAYSGVLASRDVSARQARAQLKQQTQPWPEGAETISESPYKAEFRQGATVVPRRLFLVNHAESGRLGSSASAPLVESRLSSLDKKPWNKVPPLKGQIEKDFLKPLLLGESVAPFRVLSASEAIIPWDKKKCRILTSKTSIEDGYPHLARWLKTAENAWVSNRTSEMSLTEQLDFYAKLTTQFPIRALRIVFAASGKIPCAAIVRSSDAIVEHAVYWAPIGTVAEGHYLAAILNSEEARRQIEHRQAQGQWGARHFDKLMLSLPIPRYSANDEKHRRLAELGREAEQTAATAAVPDNTRFQRVRKIIREHLLRSGVTARIDHAVRELLAA